MDYYKGDIYMTVDEKVQKILEDNLIPEIVQDTTLAVKHIEYENGRSDYLVDVTYGKEDSEYSFRVLLSSFNPDREETYDNLKEASLEISGMIQKHLESLAESEEPEVDIKGYSREKIAELPDKLKSILNKVDTAVGYFAFSDPEGTGVLLSELYPILKEIDEKIDSLEDSSRSIIDVLKQM